MLADSLHTELARALPAVGLDRGKQNIKVVFADSSELRQIGVHAINQSIQSMGYVAPMSLSSNFIRSGGCRTT